jgi:hypothetical protein
MSNLQSKRRIRTVNIKLLYRLFEKSSETISNNTDKHFQSLLDIRDTINEKFTKVSQLDEEISLLIEDEEELQEEVDTSMDFNLLCKNELSIINKHLQKHDPKPDSSSLSSSSKNKTVKLPMLKLEPFDGKTENWVSFIENFNCTINYKEDLSDI